MFFSVALVLTLPYFKYVGIDPTIRKISYSQEDRPSYRCGTFSRIEILHKLTRSPESCLLSSKIIGQRFLLIGNSHADAIHAVLNSKLESMGATLYILRDPLALNSFSLAIAEREVINKNIDVVILHSSPGQLNKIVFDDFVNFVNKNGKKLIIIGVSSQ